MLFKPVAQFDLWVSESLEHYNRDFKYGFYIYEFSDRVYLENTMGKLWMAYKVD